MLNLAVGSLQRRDEGTWISTREGVAGHAVFGPYARLDPGEYIVEFTLSPVGDRTGDPQTVCAILDVARDSGKQVLVRREVRLGELQAGEASFLLTFRLEDMAAEVEYRVDVDGSVPLLVQDHRSVLKVPAGGSDPSALLAQKRFPAADAAAPAFFRENRAKFRGYYERGVDVGIDGDDVILTVEGVSFHARCHDDMNFINELFYEKAYNFLSDRPCCVIDVGMNIGLASLLFATKEWISEIHAFEPYKDTFDRASANLALNPRLAGKIRPNNFGLSDRDDDTIYTVPDHGDSGAMRTTSVEGGRPIRLVTRDTAATLRPLIAAARAKGLDVIVKVDCEGAEFEVFRSLDAADMLKDITAFMVEWHRYDPIKEQGELIAPLRRNGFICFDLSRETGNGFFYAARIAGMS